MKKLTSYQQLKKKNKALKDDLRIIVMRKPSWMSLTSVWYMIFISEELYMYGDGSKIDTQKDGLINLMNK